MSPSIGGILKEARTKKAVSLEEVHAKIKIHPRVLQLLEEEKFDKLPGPLFVKSFLKSYAQFLEVNADELLEVYEKQGRKDPEQLLFIKPAGTTDKVKFHKKEVRQKPFRVPLALAALVFLGAVAALLFRSGGPFAAREKAGPRPAALPETESSQWLRSAGAGNFPFISKDKPLKLQIKALENVWIRVTCDGKVLFQSILKRGAVEVWTAKDSIQLWTGNAASMVLSLNGTSLGSPGRGVVKDMTITREGLKIAG